MSALTSLLVRDHKVPVRKIEESIQRQVIAGGGLDTILLEAKALPENELASYCAAVHGLGAATRRDCMEVARDVIRTVPSEVAERHRLIPLSFDGNRLVVAVAMPLSFEVEQQLGFLLGVTVEQKIAPEVRVAAALEKHFRVEMVPRMRRLARKLDERPTGTILNVKPLAAARPSQPEAVPVQEGASTKRFGSLSESSPPAAQAADGKETLVEPVAGRPGRRVRVSRTVTLDAMPVVDPAKATQDAPLVDADSDGEAEEAKATLDAAEVNASDTNAVDANAADANAADANADANNVTEADVAEVSNAVVNAPLPTEALPVAVNRPKSTMPESGRARARIQELSAPPPPNRISIPQGERLRRHRGPLTAARAVELLKGADVRDEILEIGFAFFRQFFDASAIFVVHDGQAEGLDITGPGTDFHAFQRLSISLDEPSPFQIATAGPSPVVAMLNGENERLAKGMGRLGAGPALVAPVAIGRRVVLFFYGDRSGESFTLSDVPEPIAFVPRVADAIRQLILRRKYQGTASSPGSTEAPKKEEAPAKESPEERPLADDESHVRWSSPPPPSEMPGDASLAALVAQTAGPSEPAPAISASAEPERSTEDPSTRPASNVPGVHWSEPPPPAPRRRRRGRKTSVPFEVLGVPRSAPPPPMPGELPTVTSSSRPPDSGVEEEGSDPSFKPAVVEPVASAHEEVRPAVGRPVSIDEENAAEAKAGPEDEDDFPELTIEEGSEVSEEALEAEAPPKKRVGAYVMRGGSTEVVRRSERPERGRKSSDPATTSTPSERPARSSAAPLPLTSTLRRPGRPEAASHDQVGVNRPTVSASRPAGEATQANGRRKRERKETAPETPSVIVEMGANIEAVVRELRFASPDEPEAAVQAVLQHGEGALPVLVREFPGPLYFDRAQPHRRLPRGRDISAIGRAIVAFGDLAVPYVVSLLGRRDPDTRFYAVLLSSEFSHARLVQPLGQRVFDGDRGVATLALDVLRTLRPFERELTALLERIRAEARVPRRTMDYRRTAVRALGELRDKAAVELLISFLEKDTPLTEAAGRSLRQITRQNFGRSVSKWRTWYENHRERHRVEWLIEALGHSEELIRREASEELKELTQEYYGYHPALSKKERDIAQRKYRRWWDEEGAQRFGA